MDTFFTNRYYKINRKLLLILGTWPHGDPRYSQFRRILIHVMFVVIILPQILALVTSDLSLKSITEVFMSLIPCCCILVSYISSYYHGKMEVMLEHIRFDWYNFSTGKEQKIIEKYANLVRTCTVTVSAITFSNVLSYNLPQTLIYLLDIFVPLNETRPRELTFKVELFIDQKEHFLFLIMLTYVLSFFVTITVLGTYLLLVMYVVHACAMLEIIGYMLKHLFDIETYDLFTTKDMENIMTRLIRCVFFHERTTRYVCTINSLYKASVLIHTFLMFVVISLSFIRIFYMKNSTEDKKDWFMALSYVINMFVWLFLYASISQILMNKSTDLLHNAYAASWYMAPYKVQKLLIMIQIKSMRCPSLDIGGIFDISFYFYTTMVKHAVSYAMILHSLRR